MIGVILGLFLMYPGPSSLLAQVKLPCSTLGVTKPKLCVSVGVQNGYLRVREVELKHPPTTFPWGRYQSKKEVEDQLASYVAAVFSKQRLYEMDLPASSNSSPPQPINPLPPNEVKTLTEDSLCKAITRLKAIWPQGHELDLFIVNALPARLETLGLTMDTPLFHPSTRGSCSDSTETALLAFDIDPPIEKLDQVQTQFDLGAKALAPDGRLQKENDVRDWLQANYEKRFWIASAIRSHFEEYYRAAGFNPTVICAVSTVTKKFIVINESARIGRIRLPADDSGQHPDPATEKILYLLLETRQWEHFANHRQTDGNPLLVKAGDGSFALCLPQLDGKQCSQDDDLPSGDEEQRSLAYLNTFWLSDRGAALQSIGYSLITQNENLLPIDDIEKRTAVIDLVIQKIATGAKPSPAPTQTPSPSTTSKDPAERSNTAEFPGPPASPAVKVKTKMPGKNGRLVATDVNQLAASGDRVAPVDPAAPTPAVQGQSKLEYGVGVQYRPDQGVRFLADIQSIEKAIGPAILSASGQAGTDGTHAVGQGNLDLDWLWFETIHRRASLQISGSTDATAQRILGGIRTDERRTGGGLHAELEIFRDRDGLKWSIFAEPHRETASLTVAGTESAKVNLTTITLAGPLVFQHWNIVHPMNIVFTPEVKTGSSGANVSSPYAVTTVRVGLHRRLSNTKLLSMDLSSSFQMATSETPIVDLPSLGGSESVRGFQADDALGHLLWTIQSELWAPVPGTTNADEQGIKGFLKKNIRLAGFFDVGGVSDTKVTNLPGLASANRASIGGTREGPGLGIRFIQGLIALKFDWAYGFGQGVFGSGHGRFYISVSTNGAF